MCSNDYDSEYDDVEDGRRQLEDSALRALAFKYNAYSLHTSVAASRVAATTTLKEQGDMLAGLDKNAK